MPLDDMLRTFNMGIGLIIVTAAAQAEHVDRGARRARRRGRARHRRDRAGGAVGDVHRYLRCVTAVPSPHRECESLAGSAF